MNKLKIAITGANGYIGSRLSHDLCSKGHIIYKMCRKVEDNNVKFIHFELGKKNDYTLLAEVDVLIHCAYDFSITDYHQLRKINLEGSIELFQQAKALGVKRIIYISSTSAFETAISNYGKIKYELEQYANQMNITTIRPGLVFSKDAKGIIGAIQKIATRLPIVPIIGNGNQQFFPCHLDDLSSLVSYLLTTHEIYVTPIIAASKKPITFKQLVILLASIEHKKPLLLPVPFKLVFFGLKFAELLRIPLGLRSDSLKYMNHYNKTPDFSITEKIGIHFRPFDTCSL